MVEKIKKVKDDILSFMEAETTKYGGNRMDVKELGELADIVKDLAQAEESCWEAQYYRHVSEAMEVPDVKAQGYKGSQSRMGYDTSMMRNTMSHADPIMTIREMLATGGPELRAQIRNEILGM